jgi:predicted nucleic acid-binding protein
MGRLSAVRPLSAIDGLLAATAKADEPTLVTRNAHHVLHTGVALLHPFDL